MIPFLFFLAAFLLLGLVAFVMTRSDVRGRFRLEGPGPIADHLRARNRLILLVVLFLVVAAGLLEVFVYEWHNVLLDLQYGLGAEPVGVTTYASGAGLSWALYLAVLAGAAVGLIAGSYAACKQGEASAVISPRQLA